MPSSDFGIRPRTIAYRKMPWIRRQRTGTQTGRTALIALGPTAWYDTRDLTSSTQQTLPNRVGTGNVTFGSTGTSDTNDPTAITRVDDKLWIPNVSGNYARKLGYGAPTTPTAVEGIYRIKLDSNPTATIHPIGIDGQRFDLNVATSGAITVRQLDSAAAGVGAVASAVIPGWGTIAGTWIWIRGKVTTAGVCTYAYSLDDTNDPNLVSWTTLAGGTGSAGTGTFLTTSQTTFMVGSYSSSVAPGQAFNVRYASLTWSPGGEVRKFDASTDVSSSTQTTLGGDGLTVARAASGLTTAVVIRPLAILDGVDDYLQLPAGDIPTFTATTGAGTVMQINRVHNLAGAATKSRVWSSESATDVGAYIYLDTTNAQYKVVAGGATTTATTAAAAFTQTTQLHAVAAVFDNGTAYAYSTTTGLTAGTSYAGVGTVTHANPRTGSQAGSVTSPADFEHYVTVVWQRALTSTELITAATYLLGVYS